MNTEEGKSFIAHNIDCVTFAQSAVEQSIDFSVYSPPFANLYTYSSSDEDMGNCADDDEFIEHYKFLIREIFRMTKPGRLSAVHCIDLPSFKWKHGEVGLRDFPGMIIAAHQFAGWIYHSRITVWKDPVVEMQRTKSVGLLHKQLKKDSAMSRAGLPDYVLVFRKPGENKEPISHTSEEFPVDQWQKWASPVWMDVNQTNTLNVRAAREAKDEKHICPLQLDLIDRCLVLWSNRGDVVFSPFMGIGSEGVRSIHLGRKFVGTELKSSYYKQAVAYLKRAESESEKLI